MRRATAYSLAIPVRRLSWSPWGGRDVNC